MASDGKSGATRVPGAPGCIIRIRPWSPCAYLKMAQRPLFTRQTPAQCAPPEHYPPLPRWLGAIRFKETHPSGAVCSPSLPRPERAIPTRTLAQEAGWCRLRPYMPDAMRTLGARERISRSWSA